MGAKYNRPADRKLSAKEAGDLVEKVVSINRVAKVVRGGRRFSFSALVVVGDGNGHVGYGLGKANEVPDAIRKGTEAAKKALISVPLEGVTIPYMVKGISGAATVLMQPASPGTGVIAGGTVRNVLAQVGIKDVLTKSYGSRNPHNVLSAVFDGLLQLETAESVATRRRKKVEEIEFKPYGL